MEENNFSLLRNQMVEYQLRHRGIRNENVLNAFKKVPRHKFVDDFYKRVAYEDHPLPIGDGQTISQPYIVAQMTEALELSPADKVLEIGTGSGYQAAILAEITDNVYTVESVEPLFHKAQRILDDLGYDSIRFKFGDGKIGWAQEAPFDAILVTAATKKVPEDLLDQLSEDHGRMILPVGGAFTQELLLIEKDGEEITKHTLGLCRFVPLV
ncbi:MAG: protein-L-isoaspartate(D-aspartate) O-methyltransferase [Candidatus Izemoplasmataceae bacterium]